MADERIELGLDLSQAAESAKQLSAVLQTTKVDATAFGAALQSVDLDAVALVAEATALQLALEQLGPSQANASQATTDFSAALDQLIAAEAAAEAETKRLAGEALAQLAAAESAAAAENARLAASARDLIGDFRAQAVAVEHVGKTYDLLAVAGHGYDLVEKQLNNSVEALIDDLVREAQAMRDVDQASTKTATSKQVLTTGTKNLSSVMIQAGYAAQDFTSQIGTAGLGGALNAVANNIPIILVGLGVGGGLAGIAAVAAAAVGTLYNTSGDLARLWQGGQTKEEAKAMEDLAKATKNANEQLLKQVEGVQGDETTKRKNTFKQAVVDYGGGGKLLDDLSKGNEQDRLFFAKEVQAGLGGDANSGKLLGLQNSKFAQVFGNAESADAIAADEKENARRAKASADAEARRKNNLMAQAQLEDAAGGKIQDEDERQAGKALDAVDRAAEAAGKARSKFDQFADKREGRLAGVRERATLGNEFDGFARDQGFEPTRQQGDAAAKQIQALMGQGASKDEAAALVLQELVKNQQQLATRLNQIKGQYDQIRQQAETVPNLMDAW